MKLSLTTLLVITHILALVTARNAPDEENGVANNKNKNNNSLRKLATCVFPERIRHNVRKLTRELQFAGLTDDYYLGQYEDLINEVCTSQVGTIVSLEMDCGDVFSMTDFPLCLPKGCTLEEMEEYMEENLPGLDDITCTFDVTSSAPMMQGGVSIHVVVVGAVITTLSMILI